MSSNYKARAVRFIKLAQHNGWTVKVHGICAGGERPSGRVVKAALHRALAKLPSPAVTDSRYGAAMLIIHEGADANWVLLGWWRDRDILQQRMMTSPLGSPEELEDITHLGYVGCAWELAVYAFEQDAWVEHVMKTNAFDNPAAYFRQQLNKDV